MAKRENRDPVSHIPHDERWHPVEVRPGSWQGQVKWFADNGEGQKPCACAVNDVEGEEAIRFDTEAECQTRCDELNARLDEMDKAG